MNRHFTDTELHRGQSSPTSTLLAAAFPAAVANVHTIQWCKAAELDYQEAATGYLEVHPVDNAAGDFYLMPLAPGERNSCIFDQVRTTGTTVALAKVTFFPLEAA